MLTQNKDLLDDLVSTWERERPDLDVKAMAVVGRIIHLGGLLQMQANQSLKPFKMRYTDFDVLGTLRRVGEPYQLTPTRLRKTVVITSGAMTACLDRLESAGLIARKPDPRDRRGTYIQLTKKGKELVDLACAARFAAATKAIGCLSAKEAKTLASLLRRLMVALD